LKIGFEALLNGRIHPAGWPFLALFALISLLLSLVATPLGVLGLGLTAWCAYFFRDPARVSPSLTHALLAPADGLITAIAPASLPKELQGHVDGPWVRVSIFLNVFDVHVNRIPISGRIALRAYHKGQFLNASLDKASDLNERNSLVIETPSGQRVVVVQIAGLIARRILCEVNLGDEVTGGGQFGMIRFGSRVDLYLPQDTAIHVLKGQRMVGGETVMATLSSL
jgi:phosphatidylserine decarboxylase